MVELSLEQKAKAYDEALERAKSVDDSEWSSPRDIAEYIFPQLKENEDEKIRCTLINHFKTQVDLSRTWNGLKIVDILAWLEKQGEPTDIPADAVLDSNKDGLIADTIRCKIGKQGELKHTAEEVLIKAGLKPYKDGDQWCVLLGDNIQEGICGFGNTIEDALYAFLKDLIASQGEQKPAEWSKEDEWCLEQINFLIRNSYSVDDKVERLSNWLKFLKDKVQPQPKQQWSEEDEKDFNTAIQHIENYVNNTPSSQRPEILADITKLKSLRPQKNNWERVTKEIYFKEPVLVRRKDNSDSWEGYRVCNDYTLNPQTDECYIRIKDINNQRQWRPSEEQMVVLNDIIIYGHLSNANERILKGLQEQLKKLKD